MSDSHDVFISFSFNDQKCAEYIVNQLTNIYNIKCWICTYDVRGGENYKAKIYNAIRDSKVVVFLQSISSVQSDDVPKEVSNAIKLNKPVIPFLLDDSELTGELGYDLPSINIIDGTKPEFDDRIRDLAYAIDFHTNSKSIEKVDNIEGLPYKQESIRTIYINPSINSFKIEYKIVSKIPQPREIFVGRDDLLNEIEAFFKKGKRILFLEGIGGIGKSELAKQYAVSHRRDYDNIIFLTYTDSLRHIVCDPATIEISGINILLNEDINNFYHRKLQTFRSIVNERTLLIIDNFNVENDPDFEEFTEGSHNIIFTTRNAHPGYSTIKVDSINSNKIAFEIFEKNYGMSVDYTDKPYLEELFEILDYHTYTIELLAKQMEAGFLSGKELLVAFKNGQLANSSEKITGINGNKTAFDHIKSLFSLNALSDSDIQILRELSLLGNTGVPLKKFWQWSVSTSHEIIKQSVLELIHRSLVRRENSDSGTKISLHPLVSEVIRTSEEFKPNIINCRSFVEKMADDLYNAWYTPYKDNLSISDCVLSVAKYFTPFEISSDDSDLLSIWTYFANFLWQVGKFDDSIKIGHIIYDTCYKLCGEASMLTGFAAKALGGCYFNSRRTKESIPWYKQGLLSMQLSGADECEDLAMSYEKVARCYTWEHETDFEKAESYFNKSHEIRTRLKNILIHGGTIKNVDRNLVYDIKMNEERIGENIFEMSRMYQANKKYAVALEKLIYREETIKKNSPENMSGLAYIYFDKGVCYYHLGISEKSLKSTNDTSKGDNNYFKLAEENLTNALEINMKMRGALAVDTIDNIEYLADTYVAQGKLSKAKNKYMLAISMLENLFGNEHKHIYSIKQKLNLTNV